MSVDRHPPRPPTAHRVERVIVARTSSSLTTVSRQAARASQAARTGRGNRERDEPGACVSGAARVLKDKR